MKIKYWHDGKWEVNQEQQRPMEIDISDITSDKKGCYHLAISCTDVTDIHRIQLVLKQLFEKNQI